MESSMGKPRGRGENPGQPVAVGVPHFPWRQQLFCTFVWEDSNHINAQSADWD